nr:NADH dehydrogenase subunit 6 [Saussurea tanguensis]
MILSVLSSLALVSGLMVVRAKNPVHSVLFPIPVFRNTSGLLLLLGLDFFAMIFPVVHIGAIAVSFLFVVMMFHIQIAEIHEEVLRYLPVSGIIGLIFWWEMFFILDNESIPLLPTQRNTTSLRYMVYAGKVRSWTNLETLGNLLYTYYSVWFLVPSLILLVAMIGAIVLTMHRTTKVKRQDVFRRNAIDSRRTIMRGMTDLLKESSFILVRIQFVRWPSWSYRCLDTLIFFSHFRMAVPFHFWYNFKPLYDVLVEPLGYDALLLEYHGIEYPDLPLFQPSGQLRAIPTSLIGLNPHPRITLTIFLKKN